VLGDRITSTLYTFFEGRFFVYNYFVFGLQSAFLGVGNLLFSELLVRAKSPHVTSLEECADELCEQGSSIKGEEPENEGRAKV
jgi:hypothetical protein